MQKSNGILNLSLSLKTLLLLVTISSCEQEMKDPYQDYLLPAGKHDAGMKVESLQSSSLGFEAIFNTSAIYQSQKEENQHDINKLMGFSDCNSFHQENSARFGWRWLEGNLEIHAYAYVNGERLSKLIGSVPLDEPRRYQINLTPDEYIFDLQGFSPVRIKRQNQCVKGFYYKLFPYFGGDEVAPHDILIKIKINTY